MYFSKRSQSLLEYSILFAVILSAILIMQFYLKRGYQGRLKREADTVGQQYSPGHTTSVIVNTNDSTSVSISENGIQTTSISPAEATSTKRETVDSYGKEW